MNASGQVASPDGAFGQDLVERLTELEATSWWFRERANLIVWAVRRFFPEARSFLDVGCGTGVVLEALATASPEMSLAGCDLSDAGLEVAVRRVPGARLAHCDAGELDWPDRFDIVGAFDVLEHVDDDVDVLSGMVRAASASGGILLTVPQHRWLWSSFDESSGHHRRYDRKSMLALCRKAGIEVAFMTSFVSIALPAMVVARSGGRASRRDPLKDLDPGPLASRILAGSLGVERALIRAGLALPFGGSLLVVGHA
jgi:ubiquinone/menaquinone biosynthesis C-methylase UbiE